MPNTCAAWLEVSAERASDSHILMNQGRPLAAIYMAGYAVECKLKALLVSVGKVPRTNGPRGHDLRTLWEMAGFRLSDMPGLRRLFLDTWATALRYECALPDGSDHQALFKGAQELASFIHVRIRRRRNRQ